MGFTITDKGASGGNDITITPYSYDPHGNVEWLIQYVPEIGFHYIGYEYDLISGSVLKVKYNEYLPDKFFHRYTYDIDKRLRTVETSTDSVFWEKDADYKYYLHGPLKRNVIGNDKVQGLDYVYTLQGWLKGINHTSFTSDPGQDGASTGSATGNVAKDAYSMILGYYQNDFISGVNGTANSPFNANPGNSTYLPAQAGRDLFNGNISTWASNYDYTAIASANPLANIQHANITGRTFKYDELNRITDATFNDYNGSAWAPSADYHETFTYDANGNITGLNRQANNSSPMDGLTYNYSAGNNKLTSVTDIVPATSYSVDIDSQSPNNYKYDATGNLISDSASGINTINWNVYGKISGISKSDGTAIDFLYDASGKRVSKKVTHPAGDIETTYYVPDASGNIMAVYNGYKASATATATYQLTEQAIYGSDRIGVRVVPNMTVSPNASYTVPIPSPAPLTGSVSTQSVFNNLLVSSNQNSNARLMYLNNNMVPGNSSFPVTLSAGTAGTNVATYEDVQTGNPVISAIGMVNYNGVSNVTLVYKNNGASAATLIPIKDQAGKVVQLKNNPTGKSMFMKNPANNNQYYYFTVDINGTPYYHVFDVSTNTVNVILDANKDYVYDYTMALIEDRTGNSELYLKRHNSNTDNNGNYSYEIVRYEINTAGTITGPSVLSQMSGLYAEKCEMQINPTGDGMIVANNYNIASTVQYDTTETVPIPAPAPPAYPKKKIAEIYLSNLPLNYKIVLIYHLVSKYNTELAQWKALYPGGVADTTINEIRYKTTNTSWAQYSLFSIRADHSLNRLNTLSIGENTSSGSLDFTNDGKAVLYELSSSNSGIASGVYRLLTPPGSFAKDNTFLLPSVSGNIRRGKNNLIYIANTGGNPANYVNWVSNPSTTQNTVMGTLAINSSSTSYMVTGGMSLSPYIIYPNTPILSAISGMMNRTLSQKQYELKDGLGSVHVVISDLKKPTDDGTYLGGVKQNSTPDGITDFYQADVVQAVDRYVGGSPMPGRNFQGATNYRYGFNGKEKDNEVKNIEGSSLDFGARMYDPRLGRWLACDPHSYKYPAISPYAFVINNPISAIDPDGKDVVFLVAKEGAGGMGHMAVLIQDKQGQWYYVTQGGNIPNGTPLTKVITGKFPGGYNLQKLNTTDVEEAIALAKQDVNNSPYTESAKLKTTKEQDEQIYNNALQLEDDYKTGKEKYQLITNNCVDADQCTVQNGTDIKLPLDTDPRPNKYFEKLKTFTQKSNARFDKTQEGQDRTLMENVKFTPPSVVDTGEDNNTVIPEK